MAAEASWSALSSAIQDDDHRLVAKHAQACLTADSGDSLAAHCLLLASLNLDNLDQAQKVLDDHPDLLSDTQFERAYLHYRQRRFKEAIQCLDTTATEEERVLQLKALLAVRSGQNQVAIDIYQKLLQQLEGNDEDEDYRTELLANYLAVCRPSDAEKALDEIPAAQQTFTMLYNGACSRLAIKDYPGAEEMLRRARSLCEDAELSKDELVEELSPILVQLAYTRQMQGFTTEAKELYQSVLEMVAAGVHTPAIAVASLNLMSLRHGDEKHFDSAKRLSRALKVDANKLTDVQIATIQKNQVLLLLFEKQYDECIRRCKELLSKDPNDSFVALVLACSLDRLKQAQEALGVLQNQRSIDTQLAFVQMLLDNKQDDAARNALQDPVLNELHYEPAFVSLTVSFYDDKSCVKYLSDVVPKNAALAVHAGDYLQRIGRPDAAVDLLSAVFRTSPGNLALLKSLVTAYFSSGREVPADVASAFPPVSTLSAEQESAYEQAAVATPKQSKTKVEAVPDSTVVKTKKKKKKKIRYPKGFDPANPGPPPDPERWLPRHERTKGRRRNQVLMKGPQGALPTSGVQGSGRSRAHRVAEDKNVLDNQKQKIQAAASNAANPKPSGKKKGKKRR